MIKYATKYRINNSSYASDVFAESLEAAKKLCIERNIGEEIEGITTGGLDHPTFKDLNDYEFLQQLPNITHSACFLGFIAVSAGKISAVDLIGDEGVIHELIHLQTSPMLTAKYIHKVRSKLEKLQKLVPGAFKTVGK